MRNPRSIQRLLEELASEHLRLKERVDIIEPRENATDSIFGVMCVPGVDIVVGGSAVPVEVKNASGDGWAAEELNGVTFPTGGDEHYLTVPQTGKYEVIWSMSAHTGSGGATGVHGGVMVDNVAQRNDGEAHRDVSNSNDDGNIASVTVVDCPNGTEEISLWMTTDNAADLHVEHGTMKIQLTGKT